MTDAEILDLYADVTGRKALSDPRSDSDTAEGFRRGEA